MAQSSHQHPLSGLASIAGFSCDSEEECDVLAKLAGENAPDEGVDGEAEPFNLDDVPLGEGSFEQGCEREDKE